MKRIRFRRWRRGMAVLVALVTATTVVVAPSSAPARDRDCGGFANQAAAQAYYVALGGPAVDPDRLDGDRDGIACESLPCPCSSATGTPTPTPTAAPTTTPVPTATPSPTPTPTPVPTGEKGCQRPSEVQSISFSKTKYPNIKRHAERAIRKGWPTVLVLNRPGADARRDRLLESVKTKRGYDRDEYPPAVGRGRGPGLTKGSHPRGWKADVAYVASTENRSHGSVLGTKLRRFCDGTKFKYVFY